MTNHARSKFVPAAQILNQAEKIKYDYFILFYLYIIFISLFQNLYRHDVDLLLTKIE